MSTVIREATAADLPGVLALSSNLKRDAAHAFYDSLEFQRHGYSFLMPLDGDEEHPADEEHR